MANTVYVLTNPAMPGIVKIGITGQEDAQDRIDQLYKHSGVPLPFECVIAIEVTEGDAAKLEKALHTAFGPQRVNPKREFFQIDPYQAEAILRAWARS